MSNIAPSGYNSLDWSTAEIEGVDARDYPDMCDAYCTYIERTDGIPVSDEMLDIINDTESDRIQELARESLF